MNSLLLLLTLSLSSWAQVYKANTSLSDLYSSEARSFSAEEIVNKSMVDLKALHESDLDTRIDNSSGYAKFISLDEASDVKDAAMFNPVVSQFSSSKYDPNNVGIGYCFGRAMFINLDLAYRKLDRDSIKKAFVVGRMQTPDGNSWGWHVTTIVRSKDKNGLDQWLAIDPIVDGIITVEQWYNQMYENYSTDGKLRLYITETGKFGPTSGNYHQNSLTDQFYNNYFIDMLKWFEQASQNGDYDNNSIKVKNK